MQNRYFGDIHDFYKFYLLDKVLKNYTAGIHWCLVSDDNTEDGKKPLTEKEKELDEKLYSILTSENKKLRDIKKYLPKTTRYFDELIDNYDSDNDYEEKLIEKLNGCDIIFLDPDNGIEVNSTNNKTKHKYVSYRLLSKLWENNFSLIIYQHRDRSKTSILEKINRLISILKCKEENIEILYKNNVYYIFLIQKNKIYFKDHLAMFFNSNENPGYKYYEW